MTQSSCSILALPLLLSACAGSVLSYPTLAPRPVEQAGGVMTEPATATAITALPPAVTARATALVSQARAGDESFVAAVRSGCAAVARGHDAANGSEPWVAGEQAISVIDAARAPTAAARDDIDALVLEQAAGAENAPTPTDLTPLLTAASDIAALDGAQRDRLDALRKSGCRP